MKETTFPGFTAEDSLYQTKGKYHMLTYGDFSKGQVITARLNTGAKCDRMCEICALTGLAGPCGGCERCLSDGFPI